MQAPSATSDFLRVMRERGYIHQMSDEAGISDLAARGELNTYVGYDCTAPSLHVGSLISIMMLHWLQETGAGKPIVLMGGGTTRVGDPSGKDESRQILTVEQIDANKDSLKQVFGRLMRFGDGALDAVMVDNADWLTKLNYIDFLRDVGRHFSVNRMLSMDSVKMRLDRDQELSFLEFNYMCLQSYDFVELHRRYGCRLQMGGSDQWGNIVTGLDLGRRMGAPQLFALTCPLITTSSGAKMGKTAAGAVWLKAELKSPYDYWQFWRNTEDADVGRFLRLFTLLPLSRDRPSGGAGRGGDQRGQEGAGHRGDGPDARPGGGSRGRRDGPADLRTGDGWPRICRRSGSRGRSSSPGSACSRLSSAPASWARPARRDGRSGAAASGSTTRRSPTRPRFSGRRASSMGRSNCRSVARNTSCSSRNRRGGQSRARQHPRRATSCRPGKPRRRPR